MQRIFSNYKNKNLMNEKLKIYLKICFLLARNSNQTSRGDYEHSHEGLQIKLDLITVSRYPMHSGFHQAIIAI